MLEKTMKERFFDKGIWHGDPAWRNVALVRTEAGDISKVVMIDLEPQRMIEQGEVSKSKDFATMWKEFKEVLGYDTERDRFFESVVAVRVDDGFEIGLVTGRADGPDGTEHTIVFVPSSPNPSNGRLLLLPPDHIKVLDLRAADALRGLVSMGKTPLDGRKS